VQDVGIKDSAATARWQHTQRSWDAWRNPEVEAEVEGAQGMRIRDVSKHGTHHNGWKNVPPRSRMASTYLGYVGSERPLDKKPKGWRNGY